MKKSILFAILFTCFCGVIDAQKPTIYCTVFINMAGNGGVDFGTTADLVPAEMQEMVTTNLKKKKTFAAVITTMSAAGWEYVDLLNYKSDFGGGESYILFRLRE